MGKINTYSIGQTYNVLSDAASSTGTTNSTNTILKTISWTRGQFSAGDIVTIEAAFSKVGTSGGYFHQVWYNNANNLTNAVKIYDSTVNPTNDSLYVPAGLTYSNVFCRLQVVEAGELGVTYSTFARDPNRTYNGVRGGGEGTFSTTTDLFWYTTDTPASFWQKIGTIEGRDSIQWHPISGTRYIHFTGGVENSSDRLRCEWAKISGFSSSGFSFGIGG